MGSNDVDWRRHEREVAEELGLRQTVSSGNQWYEKDDATSAEHPMDNEVQFDADMKCTSKHSYSINLEFMNDNRKRSIKHGKIFLLPVRFEVGKEHEQIDDYVVLGLKDFEYLTGLDSVRKFRKEAERSHEAKEEFISSISPIIESLNNLTMDVNLTGKQRNVIFTAIDIIDKALEEM